MTATARLTAAKRLADGYRTVLLDLDGVVYLLDEPIAGAVPTVAELRAHGVAPVFVTNNAARRPVDVAAALTGIGIDAEPAEVRTSAQAAAAILAGELPVGAAVLVVGSAALRAEIDEVGLHPVRTGADGGAPEPVAVVQGYSPDIGWRDLAEAVVAIRRGARWVATNQDLTLPSAAGPLPGNGTLVGAVSAAVGRAPDAVAGKPQPAIFVQAAAGGRAGETLVIGDRPDTDIAGANAAGMDGMLVLSGVVDASATLSLPPDGRPQYLGWTIADVLAEHPAVHRPPGRQATTECRDWVATVEDGRLRLAGDGEPLDALRALCELSWAAADGAAQLVVPPHEAVLPIGAAAMRAARVLGLAPGP